MRADAVGVMIIPLVVCKVYLKRASRFLSSASIEDSCRRPERAV